MMCRFTSVPFLDGCHGKLSRKLRISEPVPWDCRDCPYCRQARGDISCEFVQELINTSDAALQYLERPGVTIPKADFAELHLSLTQGVAMAGAAGAARLLGMMGPRGFGAAANFAVKMGVVRTTHQVARQFGSILRVTRARRGLGRPFGGVALGFAINDVIQACKARDEAWECYRKICAELDKIASDLTANVDEFMRSD
ncbi:hypothetical protein BCR44DRAFT_1175325 [Catenaria anguillulae PL171]|uniref:Uncharacterized protein n=1 Tax=Catenaria anguillulae PL171 TaxID=765915 RepID=A0A1Y2I0U7_9FUNG|nr:hypothetical protein BCR44DRAFT_1175325 [Catenaria anguillulae PL171]